MSQINWEADKMLDVYIYDYLVKNNLQEAAKTFQDEAKVSADPVAIDAPKGFLLEWWSVFWDIFIARTNEKHSDVAASYLQTQQIKAEEHRHLQQQQHPYSVQELMLRSRQQQHQNVANLQEQRMRMSMQRESMNEMVLKQRFGESAGQMMDPNRAALLKSVMSPGHSSGQVLNGSANPGSLQQAQVRNQQFSGLAQDIKPEMNSLLNSRAAVSDPSLIRAPGSNHVTLKGWPLAAGDQVRSGAIQNQLHLLSPQQQLLFQNNGNIDSHRLRMLIENNKSTGDMILNAGSPGQNSAIGHVDPELIKKITQLQQQQNQINTQQFQRQSSNQLLSQHDKSDSQRGDDQGQNPMTQNEHKRKQHGSSSGPANSSGTANTVGPVPSSAPSTPSTHTPGDVISLPAIQPADIDRFGEERALNDIDSFLSHDDTDIRETTKGFTFGEIASTGASTNKVVCCHFSADGKHLITGGHDKKAVLWNTDSLKQIFSLNEHTMFVTDVRFSPSMARLATSSFDKHVRVWDVNNPGFTLRNFTGHSASVRSLDFHPNMEDLICSCDDDGEIRYWSIKNGSVTTVFKGATSQIRFQPRSGRYLAAAAEKNVNIIDSDTQTCLRSLKGHQQSVTSLCWDPSGQYIASASEDLVRVWAIGSRNESDFMHELNCTGNKFYSCAFHPTHSSVLIIGCYQSILLWDMLENKTMTVPAHEGLVASLAVSNANGLVASASYDKVVKLWK